MRIVIGEDCRLLSGHLEPKHVPGTRRRPIPKIIATELVIRCPKVNAVLLGNLMDVIRVRDQGSDAVWKLVELWNGQSSCSLRILEEISSHRCVHQLTVHDASRPAMACINKWLKKSNSRSAALVEKLRICRVRDLSSHAAQAFGESLIHSSVSQLVLEQVRFTSLMTVQALVDKIAMHHQWDLLSFEACCLEDVEVAAVAHALVSGGCHVNELSMPSNYCQEKGMVAITELLLDSKVSLKQLDLSSQDVWDDRQYLVHLSQALSSPQCCLEQLHLSSSFVGDDSFVTMIQALVHNFCLRSLNLRHNRISDRGIDALSCHLPMLSLESLDLRNNLYSSRPVTGLSAAMSHQRTLRSFRIDHLIKAPLLEFYTVLNQVGRHCQGDPTIPLGVWPLILHKCQLQGRSQSLPLKFSTNDVIFEMLRSPGLLQR